MKPSWTGPAVGWLTFIWLVALIALAVNWFSLGLAAWAGTPDHHASAVMGVWIGSLLFTGPILISVVAAIGRRKVAAAIFGILAAIVLIPAAVMLLDSIQSL